MNGTNSSAKHYDMVVIGSGAAGHHGAMKPSNSAKRLRCVCKRELPGERFSLRGNSGCAIDCASEVGDRAAF
jgi:predicted flavoprotein YhiN